MKVLLASNGGGLYTDAFAYWLRALSPNVKVLRGDASTAGPVSDSGEPELALVDIDGIPTRRARTTIANFRVALPNARLVAIGSSIAETFGAAIIEAGADAYLPKSHSEREALELLEVVLRAKLRRPRGSGSAVNREIRSAPDAKPLDAEGRKRGNHPYGLTRRELDMLELACFGLSNLQIAKRHKISVGVVKLHLHHAYEKLGVEGRVQAIRIVEHLDVIRDLQLQQMESTPTLLDCLLPHMSHERHRKGHVLFRKGEPGNAMYYVQQGKVQLPEIGASMTPGDVFGELGVFAPAHARTSSARCEVDTDLFKLTADQTKRLCLENPKFAYYVIGLIADRLVGERTR
jgi:two-component system nitrate/nitrite response regulator NarL